MANTSDDTIINGFDHVWTEFESMPDYRQRSRSWVFTINNFHTLACEALELIEKTLKEVASYFIMGFETGAQGTPHIQGYITFKNAIVYRTVRKLFDNNAWCRPAKADAAANKIYCIKEGDYLEFGVEPMTQKRKGDAERSRWAEIHNLAKRGKFEELGAKFPRESIVYGAQLERCQQKSIYASNLEGKVNGEWCYGVTNARKSTTVRTENPGLYVKHADKWWDHYMGEETVLIEDVDLDDAKFLRRWLKIWADRWTFPAEVKGSYLKAIRPKKIIITSQFSIDSMWKDEETRGAMKNRFVERYFEPQHTVVSAPLFVPTEQISRLECKTPERENSGSSPTQLMWPRDFQPTRDSGLAPSNTGEKKSTGSSSTGNFKEKATIRYDPIKQRDILWVGCKPVQCDSDISDIETTPPSDAIDSEEMSDYEQRHRQKKVYSMMDIDAEIDL